MKLWKYILSAVFMLFRCPHFRFQNKNIKSLTKKSEGKTKDTTQIPISDSSTSISSINVPISPSTVNIQTNSTSPSTVNTQTNSTLFSNETNSKLTSQTSNPLTTPSVSTFSNSTVNLVTTASVSVVFTNPPIFSTYRSRVRFRVIFNDTFIPEYYNEKSPVLYEYLKCILSKLSDAMPTNILRLNAIFVFSVLPGSVVIDMESDLRSNYVVNDSMILISVTNALLKAFPQKVFIVKMWVTQSSISAQRPGPWVAGLVIAGVVALIMTIVALVLWYRYCPNKCCFRKQTTSTNVTGNSFKLEYDNKYNDKHPIVF